MEFWKTVRNVLKKVELIFEYAVNDIGYWALFFIFIGAVGAIFSFESIGRLIASYIFFLIGIAFFYRRHPVAAISVFLIVIYFFIITLALIYQEKFDILNAGTTLILVIITGWYAKNMHTQIVIMNNEKLGKVIAEISRSFFSKLKRDIQEEKSKMESKSFITQLIPFEFDEEKERNVLKNWFKKDIYIFSRTEKDSRGNSRLVISSPNRLLAIDDHHLRLTILKLKELDDEYNKNLDNLKSLFKKFDNDFG